MSAVLNNFLFVLLIFFKEEINCINKCLKISLIYERKSLEKWKIKEQFLFVVSRILNCNKEFADGLVL